MKSIRISTSEKIIGYGLPLLILGFIILGVAVHYGWIHLLQII